MKTCREYYLLDIVIDGAVIRKGKYTKILTPISHKWQDYNENIVEDPEEIKRLDAAATDEWRVDEEFCDHDYFIHRTEYVNEIGNIPTTAGYVVVDWIPESDFETIHMAHHHAVNGDSYLIYIKNNGLTAATVELPIDNSADEEEAQSDDRGDAHHVSVCAEYVKLIPGTTGAFRSTYRDGVWYWEVHRQSEGSGQSQSYPVTIHGDADYLVFRYIWESSGGTDFDTATEFVNTGIQNMDGKAVGWNCPGNNISAVNSILHWAGDNTKSGNECVYISLKELRDAHLDSLPEITEIMTYGTWYASKGTGDASFNLIAYKGGTMRKNGYNFVNDGGEEVYNNIHTFNVQTIKGVEKYNQGGYAKITKIFYNKTSNSVSMNVGDVTIDNQQQVEQIEGDLTKLVKQVYDLEKSHNELSQQVQVNKDSIADAINDMDDAIRQIGDIQVILDSIIGGVKDEDDSGTTTDPDTGEGGSEENPVE